MKRFYEKVAVKAQGPVFTVCLDGRPIRSPAKNALTVPSKGLAEAVAGEWAGQGEVVDPATMPLCALANVAIDHVAPNRGETIETLAGFCDTDLLCYRAAEPEDLRSRQDGGWQPVLDWADQEYGVQLMVTEGVLPVEQPGKSRSRLVEILETFDLFALAALLKLVPALGSVILGLAVMRGRLSGLEAYGLSQLDEIWHEERWGADAEDQAQREALKCEVIAAEQFLGLVRTA